jgi:hypothetical protein
MIRVKRHKRRTKNSGAVTVRSHLRKTQLRRPVFIEDEEICREKRRHCWKCDSLLNWDDFLRTNKMNYTPTFLKKLWLSPKSEFYCCKCFRKKQSKYRRKQIQERIRQNTEKIKRGEKPEGFSDPVLSNLYGLTNNIGPYNINDLIYFNMKHDYEIVTNEYELDYPFYMAVFQKEDLLSSRINYFIFPNYPDYYIYIDEHIGHESKYLKNPIELYMTSNMNKYDWKQYLDYPIEDKKRIAQKLYNESIEYPGEYVEFVDKMKKTHILTNIKENTMQKSSKYHFYSKENREFIAETVYNEFIRDPHNFIEFHEFWGISTLLEEMILPYFNLKEFVNNNSIPLENSRAIIGYPRG